MHMYAIYYEPADTDQTAEFLGHVWADTLSKALELAAQFYEYPEHDLVAVLKPDVEPKGIHQ
jgi:hypothetical protein